MVFDRGQTKYMHCIVPHESVVVKSRFFFSRGVLLNIWTVLYPVRVG